MSRASGHQPSESTRSPADPEPSIQPGAYSAVATTLIACRLPSLARRFAPIGASLLLIALGLGTPPAFSQGKDPEGLSTRSADAASPGTRAIPNAGAQPASEATESLSQSIQRRREFPFPTRCDGNTQEMVACLWQRRDRGDLRLRRLLGNENTLERWRTARLAVCHRSSERGAGGSIQPLLWLGCENNLNTTLIEQITSPLLR